MKSKRSHARCSQLFLVNKNRRGQIFSLWLVFITMAMIGIVVGLFYVQQQNIQSLVISPMEILNERDALEIFEGKEVDLIVSSLESARGNFGSEGFHDTFRSNFINGVWNNNEMKEFLFTNLSIDGVEIQDRAKDIYLIENGIYPKGESEFTEDEFIFTRVKIAKNYFMRIGDKTKISFPMGFNFEFERKYLIKEIDNKFEIYAKETGRILYLEGGSGGEFGGGGATGSWEILSINR
jgi:hypothetical protein